MEPGKKRTVKVWKVFRNLEEVAVCEEDGKFKLFAMLEDEADPTEREAIIQKLESAFKLKIQTQ